MHPPGHPSWPIAFSRRIPTQGGARLAAKRAEPTRGSAETIGLAAAKK
jgi:hypothetical protein